MLVAPMTGFDPLANSPLLSYPRGCGVYAGVPDPATFAALYSEAMALTATASFQECLEADNVDGRGGTPRRRLRTAQAGPVQDAFYASPWLSAFLSAECRAHVVPSGSRGSYSYYVEPGDFLDIHRDILTCDVAVITALYDSGDPHTADGALITYPGRSSEPLSAIRARPAEGAVAVNLQPGQTVVLPGGLVAHTILPMASGQSRITSVLCFRALSI